MSDEWKNHSKLYSEINPDNTIESHENLKISTHMITQGILMSQKYRIVAQYLNENPGRYHFLDIHLFFSLKIGTK